MNIKYILIIFLICICLISPLSASDNITDTLESPQQGNVINITNNNYDNYFEKYSGTILEEANISSGDTLRIGNVTNKVFVIDRPLQITTISNNDLIKNGYVKLVNGSSGCVIHGLTIINDKLNFYNKGIASSYLHGIGLFYTDNNTLYDNYVQVYDGMRAHALPMGASSNNKIYNNTFISTFSTCVPMSDCNNNLFYNNYLQSTQANIFYYFGWNYGGYSGFGICINNTYIGNTLNGINKDSEFIYGFALGEVKQSNATHTIVYKSNDVIINNTISNVYKGIASLTSNSIAHNNKFINITNVGILSKSLNNISNNIFENVHLAIGVTGDDGVICNNKITNAEMGIWSMGKNTLVYNNTFDILDSYWAITFEGNSGRILNNSIAVKNYGEAIRLLGNNTLIDGNYIQTAIDSAIYVLSSNNTIQNNIISSNLYGVYIDAESYVRYYNRDCLDMLWVVSFDQGKIYNNVISNNIIDTDSYDVNLRGTVYNTTISNNNMATKESTGIFIDISDPFSNIISDNLINGQFINYTGVVLNDDTFKNYFDENGIFKFNNVDKSILLVITHLTNKVMIINTKMDIMGGINSNLLKNVHITLLNESNGTIIHDLTFRNTNKSMITINNANDIQIYNIGFYLSSNSNELLYAFNLNSTDNVTISDNTIYLGGKNQVIEGVNVNDSSSLLLNRNTLILESDKLINALLLNNLNSSKITNNSIQLNGNGKFNVLKIMNACDLEFTNNTILAYSISDIENLRLSNSSNITLNNNYFDIKSNNTKNTLINSSNVSFEFNKLKDISTKIIENYAFNINSSDDISIKNNEIYTNALNIVNTSDNIEINANQYVIYDGNINSYFNSNGELKEDINGNDCILFDNLNLKHYDLVFNNAINIISYTKLSVIDATLIFNSKASDSSINGLTFNLIDNPAIILNTASNINIKNNNFNILNNDSEKLSAIKIAGKSLNNNIEDNKIFMNGNNELIGVIIYNYHDDYYGLSPEKNQITNNNFYISSNDTTIAVYNSMSDKTTITGNEINVNAKNAYGVYNDYLPEYKLFMSTIITSNTLIKDNSFTGTGENVILIYSKGLKTTVDSNILTTSANSSYAYLGNKTNDDVIKYNSMLINGSGIKKSFISHVKQAPIYYTNDSSNVLILENNIVSNYKPGDDYAIYIENKTNNVVIKDNYLISDNFNRYSNDAIYAPSALLNNSNLYFVYVSVNGSDDNGNGSINNPFKTIKHALENVINDGKVYVLSGIYNESNITISKTLTLNSIGNVCINSDSYSLFTITPSGTFTVNNITFMNANAYAGSTFYNNGKLTLNNVSIINSTASNYGGGIYNNGDLTVINSIFTSNKAKIGGVIANNKKANIIASKFIDNGCQANMSGAAIFNSNKGVLNIDGCEFINNKVDFAGYVYVENAPKDDYDLPLCSGGVIYNRGNMYINGSVFDSNYASRSGGAIMSISDLGARKNNIEISNSIFNNNSAIWDTGGAIFVKNANFKISNSTFTSNSAFNPGGALYITSSDGIIYNSTIYKNTAAGGGAIELMYSNLDVIACNISENSGIQGGAFEVYSTRTGNHVVEKINIYNSTISGNKGLHAGGVIFAQNDINLNIKNSNIYDNFAGRGGALHILSTNNAPVSMIDVNHNWWGSADGPDDSVWSNSNYFREWDKHMNTWTTVSPNEPLNPTQPDGGNGGGQRPANTDKAINGESSTDSNLISNGGSDSGSGSGYGTGFGNGFGEGFGNGFGKGEGNNPGYSTGTGEGNRGSGSGYVGNYTNGEGTLGNLGSASTSGAGGSSSSSQSSSDVGGKAYEISKDIIDDIEKNSPYLSILLILIVLILLIIGYKRKSDEEEKS